MGRSVSAEGRAVEAGGEAGDAMGRSVSAEGRAVEAGGEAGDAMGRSVSGEGRAVDAEGRAVDAGGEAGDALGRSVPAEGRAVATGCEPGDREARGDDRGGDGRASDELEDREAVGPLMGGYRPSSLRLIDEAVAAAQAIEPSLFDDMLDEQLRAPSEAHARNGAAPTATPRPSEEALGRPAPVESSAHLRASEREESGLRMIGSLGRDRAEASGELAPLGRTRPLRSETARELVTILPRRVTREMPAVSQALESLPVPTPTSSMLVPRTSAVDDVVAVPASTGSQRILLPGSGTAASRSPGLWRRARSDEGGPGLGPLLLIVLAVVLAGTAVVLRLRGHGAPAQRIEELRDAGPPKAQAMPSPGLEAVDAMPATGAAAGAAVDAGMAADAGMQAADAGMRRDARANGADAASSPTEPGADKLGDAKVLYDKARNALDEGDFARAFAQANASLKLRKTTRTYLLRAQAELRLDRAEDALASVAAAAQLTPKLGPVWELRGRILWAARRREEARVAFEKFLAFEPNSTKAAAIRRLINEPR